MNRTARKYPLKVLLSYHPSPDLSFAKIISESFVFLVAYRAFILHLLKKGNHGLRRIKPEIHNRITCRLDCKARPITFKYQLSKVSVVILPIFAKERNHHVREMYMTHIFWRIDYGYVVYLLESLAERLCRGR